MARMAFEHDALISRIRRTESDALLPDLVRSRENLLLDGWTDREMARAVAGGVLLHLRRGWYIDADAHESLTPEQQHRVQITAVARDGRGGSAMSHTSAGVLWGLPFYRVEFARVHMTTEAPRRISSAPDVMRHVAPLGADDLVVIDGIRCTSLDRTVFDLVRTLPPEAAVCVADAAERLMAERIREWDQDAVAAWRTRLTDRLDGNDGARGIRQARWVVEFADGRAQLPGESVSRVQLHRLGFPAPDLQVPVRGPKGKMYFVDFGLDGCNSFGEFDGEGKYLDEALRSGRTVEQVLVDEKHREDWIRGATGRRFARWGMADIRTPATLASRLSQFHISPP